VNFCQSSAEASDLILLDVPHHLTLTPFNSALFASICRSGVGVWARLCVCVCVCDVDLEMRS
jgi:hypothetical protein